MRYRININDKNNNPVYEGDVFEAYIITPSTFPSTRVKVIKDISFENRECDRDFDVEDNEGNRLWNAYMVIRNGQPIENKEANND